MDSPSPYIRIGAKALISKHDRVLLIKEERADVSTFWTLPGGGVDSVEVLVDGLRREINEEIQCRAVIDEAITTCTYEHTSYWNTVTVYVIFAGELVTEPDPNRREGIVDHQWVDPLNPPASTLPPFQAILRKQR